MNRLESWKSGKCVKRAWIRFPTGRWTRKKKLPKISCAAVGIELALKLCARGSAIIAHHNRPIHCAGRDEQCEKRAASQCASSTLTGRLIELRTMRITAWVYQRGPLHRAALQNRRVERAFCRFVSELECSSKGQLARGAHCSPPQSTAQYGHCARVRLLIRTGLVACALMNGLFAGRAEPGVAFIKIGAARRKIARCAWGARRWLACWAPRCLARDGRVFLERRSGVLLSSPK